MGGRLPTPTATNLDDGTSQSATAVATFNVSGPSGVALADNPPPMDPAEVVTRTDFSPAAPAIALGQPNVSLSGITFEVSNSTNSAGGRGGGGGFMWVQLIRVESYSQYNSSTNAVESCSPSVSTPGP
jgi:hypothetical protein